jgi:hypothetical protein
MCVHYQCDMCIVCSLFCVELIFAKGEKNTLAGKKKEGERTMDAF